MEPIPNLSRGTGRTGPLPWKADPARHSATVILDNALSATLLRKIVDMPESASMQMTQTSGRCRATGSAMAPDVRADIEINTIPGNSTKNSSNRVRLVDSVGEDCQSNRLLKARATNRISDTDPAYEPTSFCERAEE